MIAVNKEKTVVDSGSKKDFTLFGSERVDDGMFTHFFKQRSFVLLGIAYFGIWVFTVV